MTETAASAKQQLQIGRYTVEAKIAEGGMAVTWLCRLHGAKGFSKSYVVKTLKPSCRMQPFLTMFVDEARLGAQFDHPNVCRVIELGDANGMPYLVQEFVDGPTLQQIITRQSARRSFHVPFACQIVARIAGALHAIHNMTDEEGRRLNVVHRDVSPSNILISRQGTPKLIDFGVARFDDRETQTEVGTIKGKPRYMAPEILRAEEPVHQSDLYSLGICFISACGGRSLSRDGGVFQFGDLEHLSLDPQLKRIIAGCLGPSPSDRWATGLELKHTLEGWLTEHGGVLDEQALGDIVGELFPQGPLEWRSEELTVALMRSELSSAMTLRPPSAWRGWTIPLLAGVGLSVMAGLMLAIAGLGTMVWLGNGDEAGQEAAFERAEAAAARGRVEDAAQTLAMLAQLPLDPDAQRRLDTLDAQVFAARVLRIRKLAAVDPGAALASARALAEQRPDDPELSALLTELVARATPSAVAPVPTAPVPARPVPVRPPSPGTSIGSDDLFGERIGRPPSRP